MFSRGASTLVAGGFQNLQAYDVLLANLAPDLELLAAAAAGDAVRTPLGDDALWSSAR